MLSTLLVLVLAQAPGASTEQLVTRQTGGSMVVPLSSTIKLNDGSSLQRERIGLRHAGFPAAVVGAPAITCTYESGDRYSRSGYKYKGAIEVLTSEPLAAIEVRVLLFDVFGEHEETLTATAVRDIPQGSTTFSDWGWNEYSENDCSAQHASLTYVARVRTKDGRVLSADPKPVIAEARRFSKNLTEAALEPSPAPPPSK